MRTLLAAVVALGLLALPGCGSHERLGPKLEALLTYTEDGYPETTMFISTPGILTLTIDPQGEASSVVRRDVLTDVKRRGELSDPQYGELMTRIEGWVAREGNQAMTAQGKVAGSVTYGARRVSWDKDSKLGPELEALTKFLHGLVATLRVEPNYRK